MKNENNGAIGVAGVAGFPTLILRDKNGNIKKLFNENFVGKFLREKGIKLKIPFLTGIYKKELALKNTITDTGLAEMANLFGNVSSPVAFTYLALGTGTTAETTSDTALEAEITDSGLARASATVTRETDTVTNDTTQLLHTWTATVSKTISELGAFNDATAGIMVGRQASFTAVPLDSGDKLQMTYKFIMSRI